jgi:hypothetical protein
MTLYPMPISTPESTSCHNREESLQEDSPALGVETLA